VTNQVTNGSGAVLNILGPPLLLLLLLLLLLCTPCL
jgi:hypothetical protein